MASKQRKSTYFSDGFWESLSYSDVGVLSHQKTSQRQVTSEYQHSRRDESNRLIIRAPSMSSSGPVSSASSVGSSASSVGSSASSVSSSASSVASSVASTASTSLTSGKGSQSRPRGRKFIPTPAEGGEQQGRLEQAVPVPVLVVGGGQDKYYKNHFLSSKRERKKSKKSRSSFDGFTKEEKKRKKKKKKTRKKHRKKKNGTALKTQQSNNSTVHLIESVEVLICTSAEEGKNGRATRIVQLATPRNPLVVPEDEDDMKKRRYRRESRKRKSKGKEKPPTDQRQGDHRLGLTKQPVQAENQKGDEESQNRHPWRKCQALFNRYFGHKWVDRWNIRHDGTDSTTTGITSDDYHGCEMIVPRNRVYHEPPSSAAYRRIQRGMLRRPSFTYQRVEDN